MNAIEFHHVGKMYRLGTIGTGTLSHDLNRWWQTAILHREDPYLKIGQTNDRTQKSDAQYVWALRDIDFSVEQGDVVGIIGKNGAGKSTLLKLLSRVTGPTTGTIRARGRIGSLLEVGTGFHPEMTGRENIFMNGAILGMSRTEIQSKLDAIVDFSGCERYIDTPVKRYSSGMTVRLGFAVAAFLEPDILVVDEVLAVGDAEFQKKAIGKMHDVSIGEGRTVLFVSHNMNAVRSLCTRGIVLNQGNIIYDGVTDDAIANYLANANSFEDKQTEIASHISSKVSYISIEKISFNGTSKHNSTIINNQPFLDVVVEGHTEVPIKSDLSFSIHNEEGVPLMAYSEGHFAGKIDYIPAGDFVLKRRVRLPKYLCFGMCYVDIAMHEPGVTVFFSAPHAVELTLEGSNSLYGHPLSLKTNGILCLESMN